MLPGQQQHGRGRCSRWCTITGGGLQLPQDVGARGWEFLSVGYPLIQYRLPVFRVTFQCAGELQDQAFAPGCRAIEQEAEQRSIIRGRSLW